MPELRLPYPPSMNRLWRNFNGRMVVSAEAREFKRDVGLIAFDVMGRRSSLTDGPVRLSITLHPVRPKRWKPGNPVRCIDTSNAIKIVEDALQGIAYENDRQVVEIHARRGEPVEGGALIVTWEAV